MSNEESAKAKKLSKPGSYRLKLARERKALTQSEVAELIGTTQINVSRWENGITTPSPYYRQKLAALFEQSLQELGLLPESTELYELKEKASAAISDSQTSTSPPALWNIPFHRNTFFTGREDIINRLHTLFRSNPDEVATRVQAISGLGGIGKTQIAIEYAYRYGNQYDAIFWINASTPDTLNADFVMLAALLNLPERHEQDQDTVVRAVKRWMSTHTNWLLILDDVNQSETFLDFLPMYIQGNVLITTRQQASGTIVQTIEVDRMMREEGVNFLLARSKIIVPGTSSSQKSEEYQEMAADIYSELDGLPLALDQAGAYIEETRCGLLEYSKLYGSRRKELLLRRGRFPINHPDSVAATWSLSFEQVKQENQAAADLLYLLAFLNADAIPEDLITQEAQELGQSLGTVVEDPLKLNQVIELLLNYSLIRRNVETKSLSIHHLVQAVLKDGMDQDTQCFWEERAIRILNNAFPDVEVDRIIPDRELQNKLQRYIPHVQTCLSYIEDYSLAFPEAGRLFNEAATYLISHAWYDQAQQMLLKALDVRRKVIDDSHPDTARTLQDLGALYIDQGRYQEAEPLLKEALAIRQKAFGEENVEVAQTLNSLANSYRKQGKYKEAEPLYLRALHIRETILGPTNDKVAESYYGLTKLYISKEDYPSAEKYCSQALYIQEQHFGGNHPKIASTLNMLAKIYQVQEKYDLAEEKNLRALEIRENTSGPDHPHIAVICNSLAEVYHAKGEYSKAEPHIFRALKIHEQSLGQEHPYMAYSLSNRAKNLLLQKDYEQAEYYYQNALAIREKHLGINHPYTAETYADLAKLYSLIGNNKESEELYSKALSIRKHTFGASHPAVFRTQQQLAIVLEKQEKESEAKKL